MSTDGHLILSPLCSTDWRTSTFSIIVPAAAAAAAAVAPERPRLPWVEVAYTWRRRTVVIYAAMTRDDIADALANAWTDVIFESWLITGQHCVRHFRQEPTRGPDLAFSFEIPTPSFVPDLWPKLSPDAHTRRQRVAVINRLLYDIAPHKAGLYFDEAQRDVVRSTALRTFSVPIARWWDTLGREVAADAFADPNIKEHAWVADQADGVVVLYILHDASACAPLWGIAFTRALSNSLFIATRRGLDWQPKDEPVSASHGTRAHTK